MNESQIEWTRWAWDFLRGCSRASPGCENCYAERYGYRFAGPGLSFEGLVRLSRKGQPRWTGEVRGLPHKLRLPLSLNAVAEREGRARVFVNSKSDTFHERADLELVERAYDVAGQCSALDFLFLTKRPDRMLAFEQRLGDRLPRNAWHGASVENQKYFDLRAPLIASSRASVRFLSIEPLLGRIDMRRLLDRGVRAIDWVIIGGESASKARVRPTDIEAIEFLLAQCDEYGVAAYVKQLGTLQRWPDGRLVRVSGKGGDFDTWPAHLQRRQFPMPFYRAVA